MVAGWLPVLGNSLGVYYYVCKTAEKSTEEEQELAQVIDS